MRRAIQRFLPLLIGCILILSVGSAFGGVFFIKKTAIPMNTVPRSAPIPPAPDNGNGPLGKILNSYQSATNKWISQLLKYAKDLFLLLAGIEFSWTAIILLFEQRELEGWVAAFIRKLMWISFFYAVLLNAPTWIPAIIDSLRIIGQNVGNTGTMTADDILNFGISLGGQVLTAAGAVTIGLLTLGNLAWMLLLGAIAVVIILCYVALALQFVMTQIEGYIVISAGMMYLGFGASRWTSSYVERFLASAVTTGIRLMVFFLIIGLGTTLGQNVWIPAARNIVFEVIGSNYSGACNDAFALTAGVIIFTVLAFRLPKLVAGVISGSPSLSAGDVTGMMGAMVGGAAAVAGMVAAPELAAAKAGAGGAAGGAGGSKGAMSASKAAGGSRSTSPMSGSSHSMSPSPPPPNGGSRSSGSALPSSTGGSTSVRPPSFSPEAAHDGNAAPPVSAPDVSTPASPVSSMEQEAGAVAPPAEPAHPAAQDVKEDRATTTPLERFRLAAAKHAQNLGKLQGVLNTLSQDGGDQSVPVPVPTEGMGLRE